MRSASQADGFELTIVWAWGLPEVSRDEFTTVELQPWPEICTLEGPVTVARWYCMREKRIVKEQCSPFQSNIHHRKEGLSVQRVKFTNSSCLLLGGQDSEVRQSPAPL